MEVRRNLLTLQSEAKLAPTENGGLSAEIRLKAGEAIAFSLTFATEAPATIPPLGEAVGERLQLTVDWWQRWAAQAKYDGPYRREAIRSALVLKLLSYAPSGAIIAAPTTSLPETLGYPAVHPRVANEQYGPTVSRQLDPPGFFGLHYGIRTPIAVLIAHVIFGAILGAFCALD